MHRAEPCVGKKCWEESLSGIPVLLKVVPATAPSPSKMLRLEAQVLANSDRELPEESPLCETPTAPVSIVNPKEQGVRQSESSWLDSVTGKATRPYGLHICLQSSTKMGPFHSGGPAF